MEQYISKDALVAEIERLVNNYDKALDYEAALEDVRDFIDSIEVKEIQEFPVSYKQSPVVLYGLTGSVGNTKEEPQVKESAEIERDKETCKENGDSLTKELVNDELEKAAVEAFKQIVDSDKNNFLEIFKAGVKWQAEQFEKNRLAACDRQAEEEEEIESDFVMGIIESERRQPTFDDAIKYGMRLQKERLLAKVVDGEDYLTLDGVITFDYYDGDKAYGCVAHDSFCLEDWGLKDMDKVKILILKKSNEL
jgi:hypothetical protein